MIYPQAARVAQLLAQRSLHVVFAESCTAGLASALLAANPGISTYLCGSWVTYQASCKVAWLGVSPELLAVHSAVSAEVTAAMVSGALERTPVAQIAAAITGHLGPQAPPALDGVCFLAIARRDNQGTAIVSRQERVQLQTHRRVDRQCEAALSLLALLADELHVG